MEAVVEATASYSWFVELLESVAEKIVLANPKKLRVIAESTKKTDRLDARVLAEFLARDMIPQAYMPTPRQRQHRALVRHRQYIRGRMTSVRNKLRRIFSDYNADRRDLFSTANHREYTKQLPLSDADRFIINQLWADHEHFAEQLQKLGQMLKEFAKKAPHREKEAREILKTVPGVGTVTIEVLLSELGDVARFGSLVFQIFCLVQLSLVLFFALLLAASGVAQEKDRQTLILLLMTDLRDYELVFGKLFASLLMVFALIVVSIPVLFFALLLGGTGIDQVVWALAICAASALPAVFAPTDKPLSDEVRADRTGKFLPAGCAPDMQCPAPWRRRQGYFLTIPSRLAMVLATRAPD